ncbi:hypothetical protein MSM1_01740 [Mycobacterium sp. SM1]|uniref:hypothetical protein n=1 Tax=Mycobacterium sp. SM1 TaxID=2816243 RepID=UPI001BCD41C9|nr:hypothetical protein [Mycobacterium sp. SM1]MBS4727141.1 hypothetical protein [Mycobacterium sp. SM1]
MPSLLERLAVILGDIALPVAREPDGALTFRHEGTFASLRVVTIFEDLDLVSLTQMVAWDLPLTKKIRDRVAQQARSAQLGAVTLAEKAGQAPVTGGRPGKTADVMLRYNFPGAGLSDDALRTLILIVLDNGAAIRRALIR